MERLPSLCAQALGTRSIEQTVGSADLRSAEGGVIIPHGRAWSRRTSNMSRAVDLYDSSYGNYESATYREVRIETYGEDFGQTSWVTTEESNAIPELLGLRSDSAVLEVGCGSGRYALHLAEKVGCRLIGLDINEPGIRNAKQLALARGLGSQLRF